jgi:hypothetical protein
MELQQPGFCGGFAAGRQLEVAVSRPRDSEAYRAAIGQALEVIEQITGLMRSLLLLARADAGQIVARPGPVALRALLERIWSPCEGLARQRGLTVTIEVPEDAHLDTDPEQVRCRRPTNANACSTCTGDGDHVGIGLSLSRAIARALALTVAEADGGLAFRIEHGGGSDGRATNARAQAEPSP